MNLDGIDVFVKVVQSGSFTQAARALQMPLTTVSGKVAALEKRLGTTLIQRTTRKLHITQAGEAYFRRCVRALEELAEAESTLAKSKVEPEGLLRITAPVDVGHSILPPIVAAYCKQHPNSQVELILTNRVVDLVGEGVDLAIRGGQLRDSSLRSKRFLQPEAALWASPAYLKKRGTPRSPREVMAHDYVEFGSRRGELKLSDGRETVNLRLRPRITVDDMEAVKIFVARGAGIGLIPDFLCRQEEKAGRLVRLLPHWTWSSFVLSFVYPPQRYGDPKTQAFIALAEKVGEKVAD